MSLEHRINIRPAFDHVEESNGRQGCHVAEMLFSVIGPAGAVTWVLYTGWQLERTRRRIMELGLPPIDLAMGAALSYHLPAPLDEHDRESSECDLLPGGKCYGSAATFCTDHLFRLLVDQGDEALWARLDREYRRLCEGVDIDEPLASQHISALDSDRVGV